jgi:hypothetical protein
VPLPRFFKKIYEFLQVGPGAVVVAVARDGRCVPRAALIASGQAADDAAVGRLRHDVVAAMRANPGRYLAAVLESAVEGPAGLSSSRLGPKPAEENYPAGDAGVQVCTPPYHTGFLRCSGVRGGGGGVPCVCVF